jgi:insertion element IS1 protein InsB
MLANFNDVNSPRDLYFPSVCYDHGSATQVLLATRCHAIVGQKRHHGGGQQQPWSSETRTQGVERHKTITKHARKTKRLERFNNTLRQRVSSPVRGTLPFSKKLAHHIGAIKYFICHYHLTRTAALPM